MRRLLAAACLWLAGAAAFAQDLAAIPPLTARVTDTASLLSGQERAALESVLADYEAQRGSQIAVLSVPSTAPEPIDQYGIRVAEQWKIGRQGTADGVILIVAKDNPRDLRRLRIEVGKGVEGAIPDALAKRIIEQDIAPHFRENDYYGGLVAGVSRIKALLEGEALPAPPPRQSAPAGEAGFGIGLPALLLLIVVVSFLFRGRSRSVGYMAGNRALNRSSIAPMVIGGILGSLSNRGGGGGFGGGGGGGGGFGGGGGDFGGGGASGDW